MVTYPIQMASATCYSLKTMPLEPGGRGRGQRAHSKDSGRGAFDRLGPARRSTSSHTPRGPPPAPHQNCRELEERPGSLAKGGTFPTSAHSGLKAWPGLGSGLSFAFLTSQLVSLNLTPHLKKKIRESPAAVRTRCPEHQARGSDGARAQG